MDVACDHMLVLTNLATKTFLINEMLAHMPPPPTFFEMTFFKFYGT